jgi:hypothetical protein
MNYSVVIVSFLFFAKTVTKRTIAQHFSLLVWYYYRNKPVSWFLTRNYLHNSSHLPRYSNCKLILRCGSPVGVNFFFQFERICPNPDGWGHIWLPKLRELQLKINWSKKSFKSTSIPQKTYYNYVLLQVFTKEMLFKMILYQTVKAPTCLQWCFVYFGRLGTYMTPRRLIVVH